MYLYHGTQANLKIGDELYPFVSFHGKPYVYATSDISYAIARSGKFDVSVPLIREDYIGNGKYEIDELKRGAFKNTFNCVGYVYRIDGSFYKIDDCMEGEYVSKKPAIIVEKFVIPNIYDFLKCNKDLYQLYKFGKKDWSSVRGGYEGYMERRLKNIKQLLDERNKQ